MIGRKLLKRRKLGCHKTLCWAEDQIEQNDQNEGQVGLSCYNNLMFCFNLTALNMDWSLERPLQESTWDFQICPCQCHTHFKKKKLLKTNGGVTHDPWGQAGVSGCGFLI